MAEVDYTVARASLGSSGFVDRQLRKCLYYYYKLPRMSEMAVRVTLILLYVIDLLIIALRFGSVRQELDRGSAR